MEIPGLGEVSWNGESRCYESQPIAVKVLGGLRCRFIVTRYENDAKKEDFHQAINNFLSIDEAVLKVTESIIFQFYKDCVEAGWYGDWRWDEKIESAADVWKHIRLGEQQEVTRRAYGDKGVYVSVYWRCVWREEHGLNIIFKNGLTVSRIGPCDGHYANSDAYGDPKLENVIYHGG
jgi:hypothetical protein